MRYAHLLLSLATLLLSACAATPIHQRETLAESGTTMVEVKGDPYNRLHTGVRLINLPAEARTGGAAGANGCWIRPDTGYREIRRSCGAHCRRWRKCRTTMSIEQALLAIIGGENALAVDIARGRIAMESIPKGAEVTNRVFAKELVD